MCNCKVGGCIKNNKSCGCIKKGEFCTDKCGCKGLPCQNLEKKNEKKDKDEENESSSSSIPSTNLLNTEKEEKKDENEIITQKSTFIKKQRCQCYKGGCRRIETLQKCSCIECNESCGCGKECKKTQNLIRKGTKPKKHIEGEEIKLEIKRETKKELGSQADHLYVFLDTEGGKVNELHDIYAVLKFGTKDIEKKIVYFGTDHDIHLKKSQNKDEKESILDFKLFNNFLDELAEKFQAKVVYLLAWCMDFHDKVVLQKLISTKTKVDYLDLKKWFQKIIESDNYELQNLNSLYDLKIKGNAHTAKYDTLVMISCFCLAIVDYFDNFVLGTEFEETREQLFKAYNEEDKKNIIKYESEVFDLLVVEFPFNNGEMKLRSGRTIDKEVFMSLLDYMKSKMYK